MAARKLQQEVEKCFKKVDEGCQEFDQIYEKIEQSTSLAQKDKQEENLKREIKKLQRMRDQIKTWHANGDVKDKEPLMDKRRQIETKMELFKAVEKAMKTKAFSKEGLSAATKLDPKERARAETCEFLSEMVDALDRQLEPLEAERESLQATIKKGKKATKEERIQEIDRIFERHRWHQEKLESIRRALENGGLETEDVDKLEDNIRYYVSDWNSDDYMEDDAMYDELQLVEEEDLYTIPENDGKSQDTQSVTEDTNDADSRSSSIPTSTNKGKAPELPSVTARRPSQQLKSPLPVLATLNTANTNTTAPPTPITSTVTMRPAPIPVPAGGAMKYASIASAAAANIGIAPLPPAPGATPPSASTLPAASNNTTTASPALTTAQPVGLAQSIAPKPMPPPGISEIQAATTRNQSPAPSHVSATASISHTSSIPPTPVSTKVESARPVPLQTPQPPPQPSNQSVATQETTIPNSSAVEPTGSAEDLEEEESMFHLPPDFQDLVESMLNTQKNMTEHPSQVDYRRLERSWDSRPIDRDMDVPYIHHPKYKCRTIPDYYPQTRSHIFDDPAHFGKIDPDTLFYIFYYQQGTYQQYLAAKSLKDQSWRYHTKYKTWFQRHEEPKNITDEFEQGTYRFFDYESTWMNRRKADFQFRYKFLEEDMP